MNVGYPNQWQKSSLALSTQSGQVLIFLVFALVIVAVVALWHVDLNTVLRLKSRTQNAGDAAALAAARWQGTTLNLIGDLNLLQALALSSGNTDAAEEIAALQARLRYMGPLVGLVAAQQAAKQNRIYSNPLFDAILFEHAEEVQYFYTDPGSGFVEPWDGCWQIYAEILKNTAEEGLAAAPDNTRRYNDYYGYHTLLNPNFYDAVAGHNWCWFKWNDLDLLRFYSNYSYWPSLPPKTPTATPEDSEIFGLGLQTISSTLPGGSNMLSSLNSLVSERSLDADNVTTAALDYVVTWTVYNPERWTAWEILSVSNTFPTLPLEPLPCYDYAGADVVTRVIAEVAGVTPRTGVNLVTWTAAAKPFGYLNTEFGRERPDSAELVLPAFHHVRLIPADSASGALDSAYDTAWREHIMTHLPVYMQDGLRRLDSNCWYCRQLEQWEDRSFRERGLDWLEERDEAGALRHPCHVSGGPGGQTGGSRRGH